MKTKEFAESIENLPKKQKWAILDIIDKKVENDMEKILAKFEAQFKMLFWMMGIGFTLCKRPSKCILIGT